MVFRAIISKIKQGLVIYLAAERRLLTERRMLAFRKRHGVSPGRLGRP